MHTFYTLFLKSCSVFLGGSLGLALFFFGWKKQVIEKSVQHFGFRVRNSLLWFRFLLCVNAGVDLFGFFLLRSGKGMVVFDKKSREYFGELNENGGVLMTFHFSNFELVGRFCGEYFSDFVSSYQPTPYSWSNRILKILRSSSGKEYVDEFSKSSIWNGVSLLKRGGVFGFVMDQAEKNGRVLKFGKGDCYVSKLPSLLARKTQAKSYVCYIFPFGFLKYRMRIVRVPEKFLLVPEEYANRLLCKLVEWRPYLWYGFFHKRFKWV